MSLFIYRIPLPVFVLVLHSFTRLCPCITFLYVSLSCIAFLYVSLSCIAFLYVSLSCIAFLYVSLSLYYIPLRVLVLVIHSFTCLCPCITFLYVSFSLPSYVCLFPCPTFFTFSLALHSYNVVLVFWSYIFYWLFLSYITKYFTCFFLALHSSIYLFPFPELISVSFFLFIHSCMCLFFSFLSFFFFFTKIEEINRDVLSGTLWKSSRDSPKFSSPIYTGTFNLDCVTFKDCLHRQMLANTSLPSHRFLTMERGKTSPLFSLYFLHLSLLL